MADRGNVRIEMTGHGRGRVWLDGVEVPNVKAVAVRCAAEKFNVVTIVLTAAQVSIDAPVIVSRADGSGIKHGT